MKGSIFLAKKRVLALQEAALKCRRADLRGLQGSCVDSLKSINARLDLLLDALPHLWTLNPSSIVDDYRDLVEQISLIERAGVFALVHSSENDPFLSRLVQQICDDIGYLVQVPVVSETSPSHFEIDQWFNVLYVPPLEGQFLLHLPDLYHELGHPLLLEENLALPSLRPVKTEYTLAIFDRVAALNDAIVENERMQGSEAERRRFIAYSDFWTNHWMREFFCDLFATFCLGPAYGWSHCHLCLKLESDPFETPRLEQSKHPSDAARMSVILYGLRSLGFVSEPKAIEAMWADQLGLWGLSADMSHKQCYPDHALKSIAEHAMSAFDRAGFKAARPNQISGVALCLNQAWEQFWQNPKGFGEWEIRAIEHLQKELASPAT
ncbi:hypothetical protein ACFORG_04330 [Lutimaribacter marinistellae]|uniref:Uncharacterized protein n=1 Tax=Lutimaribacter marinistellae TaxID=1820329 RepID=A0ABV7TDW1_9RHOB